VVNDLKLAALCLIATICRETIFAIRALSLPKVEFDCKLGRTALQNAEKMALQETVIVSCSVIRNAILSAFRNDDYILNADMLKCMAEW
jgi:hypothetical protein